MAGRRGVEHHEAVLRLTDGAGERLEDGDLLGARRVQILLQHGHGVRGKPVAGSGQDLGGVGGGLGDRVDPGDDHPLDRPVEGSGEVGGRVGGRQLHLVAAGGQGDRDRGGDGRLADAALAHGHDQTSSPGGDLVDQPVQRLRRGHTGGQGGRRVRARVAGRCPQAAQAVEPQRAVDEQRDDRAGQAGQARGQLGQRPLALRRERAGQRVVHPCRGREDAVDDQPLPGDAQGAQLVTGPLRLLQRRRVRAGDQHQLGRRTIGQPGHRRRVPVPLGDQARQRTQARRPRAVADEGGPGRRQREQPQRVAGRGGVEHDVVVVGEHGRVGQQSGELVEGRDLHGARARQLLLDPADRRVGQHSSVRADDPLPVGRSGRRGIDVQRLEPRDARHGRRRRGDDRAQHLVEVGRRVGRDEQDAAALVGQCHRGRARDGGLADAALAGEEQERGVDRVLEVRQRRVHQQQPDSASAGGQQGAAASATAPGSSARPTDAASSARFG